MLAIAGGKGGCGKTTTAIGLAEAIVDRGGRPLAVEADLGMPDLHTRLGVGRDPGLDAVTGGRAVDEVARDSPRKPGVAVCPAGGARPPISAGLKRSRSWRGPVLVDCPAGASPDAADPLRVADGTVLVSTETPESLEDTAKTAAMARTLNAPPVAAVVRGSPDERAVGRLLDCETVVTLPSVSGTPLEHPVVRTGYARLAGRLYHTDERFPRIDQRSNRTDARVGSDRSQGDNDIKSVTHRGGIFNGGKRI